MQEADRMIDELRKNVESTYDSSRERALVLTKLEEAQLWLARLEGRA